MLLRTDEVISTKEVDMELVRNYLKVEWVNLNEGYNGDFDPSDPEDTNLLRFDVSYFDEDLKDWQAIDDASYCTCMPAETPESILKRALEIIMDRIEGKSHSSISKACEHLSHKIGRAHV